MAKENRSADEMESRLKDYFRAGADRLRAPADLWARLVPRLGAASGEGRPAPWWRLALPRRWGPVPAAATAVVFLLAVAGVWLLTVGPREAPRLAAPLPALTDTPMPAPAGVFWPDSPEMRGPAGPMGPAGASVPVPTPTPLPMPTPVPAAPPPPKAAETPPPSPDVSALVGQPWAVQRMVIRNGTLSLVVGNTAQAIDQTARLAKDMGGYVVSSRMWQEGKRVAGAIAIRVPAELFTEAMRALKALAVEVAAEDTSSQDVTEEYVDLSSRLRSLEVTEGQLLQLMRGADKVEDVLAVQRELARVQKEIEQTRGRMKYLEQSSATSLIQVTLREVGLDISINTSARKARVGEKVRLSARVAGGFPPYAYRWDLGDGTTSAEEAPEHTYARMGKFDIGLTITDSKGNTATETKKEFITVEPMEALLDVSGTEVKVREEVFFTSRVAGGFPPYTYRWDLGDGTTSSERNPRHRYSRAGSYTVSLTVTDDKANTATETKNKLIAVSAPPGWRAGEEAQAALRALSSLGRWLATGFIWMAVFLPAWGVVIALLWAIARRRRST